MTRGKSDTSFKRRKFTITESLDEVLEDLAEQNYQGNVSLCLRAAIEDHRATLHGTDSDLVTQQLLHRVEKLTSRQDQIMEALEAVENNIGQETTEAKSSSLHISGLSEDEQQILSVLEATDTGLRIDDLAERLDLPTARIQPALGILIDLGIIIPNGESPTRFRLAGRSSRSNRGP